MRDRFLVADAASASADGHAPPVHQPQFPAPADLAHLHMAAVRPSEGRRRTRGPDGSADLGELRLVDRRGVAVGAGGRGVGDVETVPHPPGEVGLPRRAAAVGPARGRAGVAA